MEQILEKNETHKVIGQIYKIINVIDNKYYIGQTRSHRLNRNKYRPFGYIGRFKDHISEAKSLSKKNKCSYLCSAILKYGEDNFKCELIMTCDVDKLDENESTYILHYNSKYPNGYNLTDGGQKANSKKGSKIILNNDEIIKPPPIKNINLKRSDFTKQLISQRLKDYKNKPDSREKSMIITQKQHTDKRFEKFKKCNIERDNIDQYIRVIKSNTLNYEYVCVIINKIKTTFVGKYEPIENIKNRAKMFILDLLKWQDNLDAGTPLEPLLPLNDGNIIEELG